MFAPMQVQFDGDMFKQLPVYVQVIILCIAVFILFAIGIKYGIDAFDKIKSSFGRKRTGMELLKQHSFFSKCESWSKYKVNELYFGDEVRNGLFRAIVGTKVRVTMQHAFDALVSNDINGMSKQAFQTFVFKMITDMHVDMRQQMRDRILELYPAHGQEICDVAINHKTKGFTAFNQITDSYTERLVATICESDLYYDNIEKYEMILDAFKSALGACFPYIESTFNGFNGELDGIIKKK